MPGKIFFRRRANVPLDEVDHRVAQSSPDAPDGDGSNEPAGPTLSTGQTEVIEVTGSSEHDLVTGPAPDARRRGSTCAASARPERSSNSDATAYDFVGRTVYLRMSERF